jgi:hypothetical protein
MVLKPTVLAVDPAETGDADTTLSLDLPRLDSSARSAIPSSFCSIASVVSRDQSHYSRRQKIS